MITSINVTKKLHQVITKNIKIRRQGGPLEYQISPAEKVGVKAVQQIYKLQPIHPPLDHIVWNQTEARELCTI